LIYLAVEGKWCRKWVKQVLKREGYRPFRKPIASVPRMGDNGNAVGRNGIKKGSGDFLVYCILIIDFTTNMPSRPLAGASGYLFSNLFWELPLPAFLQE
jgi:hypothetical protein